MSKAVLPQMTPKSPPEAGHFQKERPRGDLPFDEELAK